MRKKNNPIDQWNENLELHRQQFNLCIDFLKANTGTVAQFHHRAMLKLLSNVPVAKHRLYFLFVDCLGAAGGNHLTASAEGSRQFFSTLDQFGDDSPISFQRFLKLIGAQPQNTEGLFNILSGGGFKNFGAKKAALFMRQIRICQSVESLKLFDDLSPADIYQPIPLDVVIADLCSKILQLGDDHRINPSKHFTDFNTWARTTLGTPDYFLFEDLWYWGYFTTTVDGKNQRKIGYNDDKYKTNEWIYPTDDDVFRNKLEDFCKLFPSFQ